MTRRQTDFASEPYFWAVLVRQISAVLSGRITLDQVTTWLYETTVAGEPLEHKRIAVIHGGLKLILFAKRQDTMNRKSDRAGSGSCPRNKERRSHA